MHNLYSASWWAAFGLALGLVASTSGCGGEAGGGGKARFVPNDSNVERVNGMSPSEAFHKNDRRR